MVADEAKASCEADSRQTTLDRNGDAHWVFNGVGRTKSRSVGAFSADGEPYLPVKPVAKAFEEGYTKVGE